MIAAARISAAIEVLGDIEARRRPAADALKDWGLAHRFAGSKDRAAIASLVYDALRRKASSAWVMGAPTPRAVMLGTLRLARGLDAAAVGGAVFRRTVCAGPAQRRRARGLGEARSVGGAAARGAGTSPNG